MPRYGHSKIGGVPKTPKFEMPITPPLGVLEQKNFGFPSFSIGGTFTPKMIKIGEIGVLSYLHLSWNEKRNVMDILPKKATLALALPLTRKYQRLRK